VSSWWLFGGGGKCPKWTSMLRASVDVGIDVFVVVVLVDFDEQETRRPAITIVSTIINPIGETVANTNRICFSPMVIFPPSNICSGNSMTLGHYYYTDKQHRIRGVEVQE